MFKSILPSRRVPSTDFTMVTSLQDVSNTANAKENYPGLGVGYPSIRNSKMGSRTSVSVHEKKKRTDTRKDKDSQPQLPLEGPEMSQAFDQLLDDLQIPSTLRPKLAGMDSTVKAAMLKSSTLLAKQPRATPSVLPTTPRNNTLRRAVSSDSLGSPLQNISADGDIFDPPRPAFTSEQVSAHHSPYLSSSPSPRKTSTAHGRGLSLDTSKFFSRSQVNLATSSSADLSIAGFPNKEKSVIKAKNLSPTKFCSILTSTSSLHLDIEDVKKLRLLLRNEAAAWSEEFLKLGGYSALLTRLNEILEVEWREEQHDDQVLHELLRCFKALSTSAIGCFALRSSCPTPFAQLVSLLYSDKKPGDVATRYIIVELLLLLFDLYPPSTLPAGSRRQREAWESEICIPTSNLIIFPAPHKNLFSLIRGLLLTQAPPPAECPRTPISHHEFIASLHVPRVYKTYLQVLSDVCRDYFWVFCHPSNTIWVLSETDEGKVEKPRAPGGMTGGVEFEAMGYFTTHLKLLNAISKNVADLGLPKDNELSAYRFHSDLFLSGLERIILISRKASATYYPNLHLELSRYINFAICADYELPYTVSRLIGLPPLALCKNPEAVNPATASGRQTPRFQSQSQPGTPLKRPVPTNGRNPFGLPSPKRVEPLVFE